MEDELSLELAILTLNIWGIPCVSANRKVRINSICSELNTGKYDIVALQEVWSQADYRTIKEKTAAILPYEYYFYSGVFGSGLLVLSKYPIVGSVFHAWPVNGYFHRIQHADWFGGKGVGLCKILIGDKIINFYNTHLHAEYNNGNDDYKTHRVIQAFDTAQFVEETRGNSIVQILAGDMNAQPHDISYKVLLYISKMKDCCTSDTITTNESPRNFYTSKSMLRRNPHGIRIDHIFVRSEKLYKSVIKEYALAFPERIPGYKFSYSDHEAVLVKLNLLSKVNPNTVIAASSCNKLEDRISKSDVCDNVIETKPNNEAHCDGASFRISVLRESIELCDSSMKKLNRDRVFYYVMAILISIPLLVIAWYSVPNGYKILYLLLKLLLFGIILFCVFMGSIWNYMERNGILSGKISMEIMLHSMEKLKFNCH